MKQDNQEFINKAKDSLEQLAGKTKEIFGDTQDRHGPHMEQNSLPDHENSRWGGAERKHAAGEFEYQTHPPDQNGEEVQSTDHRDDSAISFSRYENQQPVSDFPQEAASANEHRVDYGSEAVYGDPTGRYSGNEENMLSDEERKSRYEEQEPLSGFLEQDGDEESKV